MPHLPLRHVLYVDDEPDMRLLVQLTLENIDGLRVTACDSGISALEAAIEEPPQMIMLDAMMPTMDGPAVLRELQQDARLATIPVIFLTAKILPEEQRRLRALGALGVIAKPFVLDALAGQVQALWQQHEATRA